VKSKHTRIPNLTQLVVMHHFNIYANSCNCLVDVEMGSAITRRTLCVKERIMKK